MEGALAGEAAPAPAREGDAAVAPAASDAAAAAPRPDGGASSAAGETSSSGNGRRVSPQEITRVQNMIERCLQHYMNQREVVAALQSQCRIAPGFTSLVWRKLEEQNPSFFEAYYTRLKIKDQVNMFNYLLVQQVQMVQKLHQAWLAALPQLMATRPGGMPFAPPPFPPPPGMNPMAPPFQPQAPSAPSFVQPPYPQARPGYAAPDAYAQPYGAAQRGGLAADPLSGPFGSLPADLDEFGQPAGLLGEGGAFAKTFSFSDLAALEAPLQLANDGGAGALPQLEPLPRNFSLSDMGHFEGI